MRQRGMETNNLEITLLSLVCAAGLVWIRENAPTSGHMAMCEEIWAHVRDGKRCYTRYISVAEPISDEVFEDDSVRVYWY